MFNRLLGIRLAIFSVAIVDTQKKFIDDSSFYLARANNISLRCFHDPYVFVILYTSVT